MPDAQHVYVLTLSDDDGGGHTSVHRTLPHARRTMERFVDNYGIREAFDAGDQRAYLSRENSSVFTADGEGFSIAINYMRVYA